MFGTYRTLLFIRVASAANRTIYYARMLPFIGKRIKDDLYARLPAKRAASVIALTAMVLWGFLSRALYVGLLVYFPAVVAGGGEADAGARDWFLHIFFLLSFIAAGVIGSSVLEPTRWPPYRPPASSRPSGSPAMKDTGKRLTPPHAATIRCWISAA